MQYFSKKLYFIKYSCISMKEQGPQEHQSASI